MTLSEVVPARQVPGEPERRWFTSEDVDLIVWCGADGAPIAFQLCYDRGPAERAVTWTPDGGLSHRRVDDGEGGGGLRFKATPILVPDGAFDAERVRAIFAAQAGALPPAIVEFISARLTGHVAGRRDP